MQVIDNFAIMSINLKLGHLIVELRRKRGLSQERLALDAGVDRRYLSDLENGRRNPSLLMLARIAQRFGMEANDLMAIALRPFDTLADLKTRLVDLGFDQSIVLEQPDYIYAVEGITDDGRVAYSRSRMVLSLMIDDDMSATDAEEFIDYNTMRALPYMGELAPIIINDL